MTYSGAQSGSQFASLSVGAGVGIWCRELCDLQPHSFQFNVFLVRSKPSGESKG